MTLSKQIVLRPRFEIEIDYSFQEILERFSLIKSNPEGFKLTFVDSHVFIKLPKTQQNFWAPQLHLEFSEISKSRTRVNGFFGPNPTVWTMFMFFHVVIGMLFFVDLIWLYSNISLKNSFGFQIGIGFCLIILWIVLYIGGTIGKKKGKPGIQSLYEFMLKVLD